ncbi:MAG: hypothetical protein KVP17_003820 [Porospora cf. gigantea B]|uniref:uncharacterized protein n=2 Tax=Porospora cf. gigantea B TaxID=2853592 RepID=UPI003571D5F4|nr:MAG: hypothetical protein KVP17_003820 [Porospora cf. gigantea B]
MTYYMEAPYSDASSRTESACMRRLRTVWLWGCAYARFKCDATRLNCSSLPESELQEQWTQTHIRFAKRCWEIMSDLRGWWVKVGQFLSARSDLLPPIYLEQLQKLHDRLPPDPFHAIKRTVEIELGGSLASAHTDCSLSELFTTFEECPIGSASIAQVHRATLIDGTPVVVKVQHAGVSVLLSQDMDSLVKLARALHLMEGVDIDLETLLKEWQSSALSELDFRFESIHQQRAARVLAEGGFNISVPLVYEQFTTKKVLVMEYCEGRRISDFESCEGLDRAALCYTLTDAFAFQLLHHGQFHSDPHPGNIILRRGSDGWAPVLMDWGMVREVEPAVRIAFAEAVYYLLNGSVMGVVDCLFNMGFEFKSQASVDFETYVEAFKKFIGHNRESKQPQAKRGKCSLKSATARKQLLDSNPLVGWPRQFMWLSRVIFVLQGLATDMNVSVPFAQIFLCRAQEVLRARWQPDVRVYDRYPIEGSLHLSPLEGRVHRLLAELRRRNLVLGCQVAVSLRGRFVVDLVCGRQGPVDYRPVTKETLFNPGNAWAGVLTGAFLTLIEPDTNTEPEDLCGRLKLQLNAERSAFSPLRLNDRIGQHWDGFVRYGKGKTTIRDLLTHKAGLARALPADVTLSDWMYKRRIFRMIEDAIVSQPAEQYAPVTYGFCLAKIVRSPVYDFNMRELINTRIITPLDLSHDMHVFIPTLTEDKPGVKPDQPETKTRSRIRRLFGRGRSTRTTNVSGDGSLEILDDESDTSPRGRDVKPPRKLEPTESVWPDPFVDWRAARTRCSTPMSPVRRRKAQFAWVPDGQRTAAVGCRLASSQRDSTVTSVLSSQQAIWRKIAQRKLTKSRRRSLAIPSDWALHFKTKQQRIYRMALVRRREEVFGKRISALEMFKHKPHLADPLLYDSAHIIGRDIPPLSGRCTARALAKFYQEMGRATLIDKAVLAEARSPELYDSSIDSLIATGGFSTVFGLGYQLFPIERRGRQPFAVASARPGIQRKPQRPLPRTETPVRIVPCDQDFNKLIEDDFSPPQPSPSAGPPSVSVGFGCSDIGGCLGVSFPELDLSISIMVNDFLTGSHVAHEVLEFILTHLNYRQAPSVCGPDTKQASDLVQGALLQRQEADAAYKRAVRKRPDE